MNQTLSLALRNLLRNRRRSVATLLALVIGACSLLLFGGYTADIRIAMLTGYVRHGGHLQVQHRDFFLYGNGNPTAYAIANYAEIQAAIQRDPELSKLIRLVSPTLQFGGIAGNYEAGVSRTVIGSGLQAADVTQMRLWNEFNTGIVAPRFALDGAPPDSAILGIGVARVLLLCEPLSIENCPKPESSKPSSGAALPGDIAALADLEQQGNNRNGASKRSAGSGGGPAQPPASRTRIELLAGHGRGTPNVTALNVVAAEDQGLKELDEVMVVLQLQQAQQLVFGRSPPKATSLMIQLHRSADAPRVAEGLRQLIGKVAPGQPLAVLDFETLNPFYTQTVQLFDTIFGFIFVLIGGIVLFTVTNTMNAAVVERTTEIGTLRAIGLRQNGIRQLFVMEGLVLGVAGALVGLVSALTIAYLVNHANLTWLPPGSSARLPLNIRVWGETGMMVATALGLMGVAVLSAWWPARRAAQLKIVDALRHI